LNRYLSKLPHINAECKLSAEEEEQLALLFGIKGDDIKKGEHPSPNRKAALDAKRVRDREGGDPQVTLHGGKPKASGMAWAALQASIIGSSDDWRMKAGQENHNTWVCRIYCNVNQYFDSDNPGTATKKVGGKALEAVQKLWGESLDGRAARMSIMWFQLVLEGHHKLYVTEEAQGARRDNSRTLLTLMIQVMYMKATKWGKEACRDVFPFQAIAAALRPAGGDLPAMDWKSHREDITQGMCTYQTWNDKTPEWPLSWMRGWLILLNHVSQNPEWVQPAGEQWRKGCNTTLGYTAATMGGPIAAVVAAMPMREGYDGFSSPDTSDVSLGHRCLPLTVNDPQGGIVAGAEMKEEDVNAFSNVPLVPVGPGSYVKFEHRVAGEQLSDALPFRVDDHPDAQSWVAKSMLERFNVDMAKYAASVNASQKPSLICIDSGSLASLLATGGAGGGEIAAAATPVINQLIEGLNGLRVRDKAFVEVASNGALDCANDVAAVPDDAADACARECFRLRRYQGGEASLYGEMITGALLSTRASEDLCSVNPFLPRRNAEAALTAFQGVLFHANRLSQIERCVAGARDLKSALVSLSRMEGKGGRALSAAVQAVQKEADALASNLVGKRFYSDVDVNGNIVYDPRFLVFEYVFGWLLRRRQVELVRTFAGVVAGGGSKIEQMLMGEGKTTCIGPLLALFLADGDSLVTQVVRFTRKEERKEEKEGRKKREGDRAQGIYVD
jgi:hypothetical protein